MRGAQPDPVSVSFEDLAGRFLARVYAAGTDVWVPTLIYDPPGSYRARWAALGIDVTGPDPVRGRKAKTRWVRAFVRAMYRLNKDGGPPLEFEAGRRRPPAGELGWRTPVRVRVRPPGGAAAAASGPGAWSGSGPVHASWGARDW